MKRAWYKSRTIVVAGLAGLAGWVGAACGSGDSASPHGSGPSGVLDESLLPSELARIYCEKGSACCAAAGLPANTDCVAERSAHYSTLLADFRSSGERTVFEPDQAAKCIAVLSAPDWCLTEFDEGLLEYVPFCREMLHPPPTKTPGEPCQQTGECLVSHGASVSCNGNMCTPVYTVADGQACGDTGQVGTWTVCEEGSSCRADTHICVRWAAEGESCQGIGCQMGLTCRSSGGEIACQSGIPLLDGEPCNDASQCDSGRCDAVLGSCASSARRMPGELCDWDPDCLSDSCTYDSVAKRDECDPVSASSAAMVNATTCDTSAAPDAGR